MTAQEFAKNFVSLPPESQNTILETLKESFTQEEYTTTVKFLGFYRLMHDRTFYETVQVAVGEAIYEELRSH